MNSPEVIMSIYLAGVLLSLPRLIASFYEIDEYYIEHLPPSGYHLEIVLSIFSWATVVAGLALYFGRKEKYFWKFSKKDLWRAYRNEKD